MPRKAAVSEPKKTRRVQHALPRKLVQQLVEDHGRNTELWNDELKDLIDASISARQLNPPLSGQIRLRKNRDVEYFWAKDVCGSNPNHERVESLRAVGFENANTNDVEMATEDVVRGRTGDGYSNEIRSGDRLLMKVPMMQWRELRKAHNVAALNMAYPQANLGETAPMSTALLDGNTHVAGEEELNRFEGKRAFSDPRMDVAVAAGIKDGIIGNAAKSSAKGKRA